MTSQQPPPTSAGSATGAGPAAGTGPATAAATGPQAGGHPSRLVPVALLVVLILIGLRGAVHRLAWQGPLHREAETIGIVLEVILGVLLVMTLRRGRIEGTATAQKLRTGLQGVLGVGMVALPVALLVNAHLHLSMKYQPRKPPPPVVPTCAPGHCAPHLSKGGGGLDLQWVLYLLLIILIIAVVIVALRRSLWSGRSRAPVPAGPIASDAESLREAISEGAAALRAGAFDDARKAIIACYVAMERSLADRGAARNEADTPDELLSRATQAGIIRGTAAARLTTLFYEARFSSHPLGDDQHGQARQALDEIAASLEAAPVVSA